MNLPKDDFTWIWGDREDAALSRFEDFSVQGGEAGFRCSLTGKLHPGARLSSMEVREFENDLRSSLSFIQASAETMYVLDQQRQIDWAKLDCSKPEGTVDEEKSQERVDKALEKALRDQARRRERRQREEERATR
jgi:hypothetical protein